MSAPPPPEPPSCPSETERDSIAHDDAPDGPEDSSAPPEASQHHTLKYHLLGPSLTKAGQDTVDQRKVSEVIFEASKGSKFFANESAKDANLTVKINRILAKKAQLERLDLSRDLRKADDVVIQLEATRDLSQTIVHIDCDAFYAAVEELDQPELRDVPMAVGKGVLTTCNYHARKFGCRSGMAGFVAMKLCPQLVCLPLNFEKYTAKAREVRKVLQGYDPRFESASIDEAYLNITEYCREHDMQPEEAVRQLREEVHEKCGITISAGIAANAKLAKICSNKNKPNGQFRLPAERQVIMDFMATLPTRKVNGVGRVFERELDAIGIKTCGDIYEQRQYLARLFGEKAFHFLINCYLGLGRTDVRPAEEHERKSVGTESTFRDMSGKAELREKLRHIAEELEKDLERTQFKGRTLVLKIKLHTYEVLSRQYAPPYAIYKKEDLYRYSEPMLSKLEKEIPGMTLRLMGLRVTHIVSMKKAGNDFFGAFKRTMSVDEEQKTKREVDADGWEVWPETEFEEAARQEREDEMDEIEALSQEQQAQEGGKAPIVDNGYAWREALGVDSGTTSSGVNRRGKVPNSAKQSDDDAQPEEMWDCPVCLLPQPANDQTFNAHMDFCLSKSAIRDTVKDVTPTTPAASEGSPHVLVPSKSLAQSRPAVAAKRKRGRPRNDAVVAVERPVKAKKLFFS
ncbi:hypothetical protein H2201_008081 [Coniosporium apollinis]|uniref:DNA polymerase kappa n=1 Tax=Coniosporium apollinis TaxID=61459 RepID=A0ABQ9NHG5_9PEZI|nr:hypothetical protein H2201_008081 [Coniosporium apollinis]